MIRMNVGASNKGTYIQKQISIKISPKSASFLNFICTFVMLFGILLVVLQYFDK